MRFHPLNVKSNYKLTIPESFVKLLLFLNVLWRFIFGSKNGRQYRSHPVFPVDGEGVAFQHVAEVTDVGYTGDEFPVKGRQRRR